MAGSLRYMDSLEEEQLRGITMKSSAISLMHYDQPFREVKRTLRARLEEAASPASGEDGAASADPGSQMPSQVPYLVHLIDSPGHVDFSSDVSTAVRLCDGALVVVDVTEGVCIQTHAVLRAAWREGVRPTLVLNKVDRLITELQLDPMEAYHHLLRILEAANVVASSLFTADILAADRLEGGDAGAAEGGVLDGRAERKIFFDPSRGNVVFASGVDGWAFGVDDFARILAPKLELTVQQLRQALWGEFTYSAKAKRVIPLSEAKGKAEPMAVSMMLRNIWEVYDRVFMTPNEKKTKKIIKSLDLESKIPPRELRSRDPKEKLRSVMRAWLPVARAVLRMVVKMVPGPAEAGPRRIDRLCPPVPADASADVARALHRVRESIARCDAREKAPCVAFISKMIAVPKEDIPPGTGGPPGEMRRVPWEDVADLPPHLKGPEESPEGVPSPLFPPGSLALEDGAASGAGGPSDDVRRNDEVFVAFARVFSGVLRPDRPFFVLGPKYEPCDPSGGHISETRAPLALYLLMGRGFHDLACVPAGNVVGIAGLGDHILKTATLASTPLVQSLMPLAFQSTPIMRVAVEPSRITDLPHLQRGLRLLNQADPCVEVFVTESGEFHLATLGEMHLQRCINDLRERFAGVELSVSPPILSFQETITRAVSRQEARKIEREWNAKAEQQGDDDTGDGDTAAKGDNKARVEGKTRLDPADACIVSMTSDGLASLRLRVSPLPIGIVRAIESDPAAAKWVHECVSKAPLPEEMQEDAPSFVWEWISSLSEAFRGAGGRWPERWNSVWCLGPRKTGPNLLIGGRDLHGVSAGSCKAANEPDSPAGRRNGDEDQSLGTQAPAPAPAVPSVWQLLAARVRTLDSFAGRTSDPLAQTEGHEALEALDRLAELRAALEQGFELAASAGPLCREPLWGLCVEIRECRIAQEDASASIDPLQAEVMDGEVVTNDAAAPSPSPAAAAVSGQDSARSSPLMSLGSLRGQVMTAMRDGIRLGVEKAPMRLVEPHLRCELHCSAGRGGGGEHLGQLYAVLDRRRARVVRSELMEGTEMFVVEAFLPVAESLGFAVELRDKTSGAATSPQMVFSHWEVLDEDPFYQPQTDEEKEEHGEVLYDGQTRNLARQFVDSVRKRKGMMVQEKLIVHAEKQRNLAKKK